MHVLHLEEIEIDSEREVCNDQVRGAPGIRLRTIFENIFWILASFLIVEGVQI